jgi:hypothetical protein
MPSAHLSLGQEVLRLLIKPALRLFGSRVAGRERTAAAHFFARCALICCLLGSAYAARSQIPPTAPDQAVIYTYGNALPVITPSLGTTVTIVGVTPAQLGSATFTASQLTYTPPTTEISASDHFGYEVQDSTTGLTTSAMVTVTLVGAAPRASAAAITLAENGGLSFSPTYSDPNHLTTTITALSAPTRGTAVINSGGASITYTPQSGFWCAQYPSACDTFTYTVTNSAHLTATATVTVVVTAIPPTAYAVSVGTAVNQTVTFDPRLSASDPQGLAMSLTGLGTPTHGAAVITSLGQAAYTPISGYSGGDSFSYTVTNSGGGSAGSTVGATVGGPLTVTVSATTWGWQKFQNGPPIEDPAINGGATGGQGP